MSNCYLKKLVANPGKMAPNFDKYNLEYTLILGSHDNRTILQIIPEYPNDFFRITGINEDQGNQVFVGEGASRVVEIVVFAEQKEMTRTYTINISRLSSKIAFLESITIHPGKLVPPFNRSINHYICTLGANTSYFKIYCEMPDSRCSLQINDEEPKSSYDLNMGATYFKIKIQSADESQTKKYLIDVSRKVIPRYIFINDPIKRIKLEDPISLSPLYCPHRIFDYDLWSIMSGYSIDKLQNLDRIKFGKSNFDDKTFSIEKDLESEKRVSEVRGQIPLTYGGFSNESKLFNIGGLLLKCNEASPFKITRFNKGSGFTYKCDLKPKWQVSLEIKGKKDINLDIKGKKEELDLSIMEEIMVEYLFYLPNKPVYNNFVFVGEENPVEKLKQMLSMVAHALKTDFNNSDLHFLLALLLEEKFMIEDTLNIKSELSKNSESVCVNSVNTTNQNIINEICSKLGFTKTPTLSQQLRTLLDEEANFISKSMMIEADNIQNLYEWKSREASQDGKIAMLVSDESNNLGQAALKYFTALKLDIDSAVKNFHVARMMIFEGKYGEAIFRLEQALSLNPNHLPSKFLLGFAQANLIKLTEYKLDRTIELLLDGMEHALTIFSNQAVMGKTEIRNVTKKLTADDENFFRLENPFISRGILALSRLLLKKGTGNVYIQPLHSFHIALHIASLGWQNIHPGCIFSQFEYVIIECHEELFHILDDEIQDIPTDIILKRCELLNTFISSCILPTTQRIIDIQENICRIMVFHQPCNEYYLINLGLVIMKKADMYPYKHPKYAEYIKHAIHTFRTALEMNGKPILGPPDFYLQGLSWFKVLRLNYLTKKAPLVICESFRLTENDTPSSLFNIEFNLNEEKKKKQAKVTSKSSSIKKASDRFSSQRSSNKSSHVRKSRHLNYKVTKCSDNQILKHMPLRINIETRHLTTKELTSKKISLFQSCHPQEVSKIDERNVKKENPLITVFLNPSTHYSRLMLGRAYRAIHQYMDAIKCFNFIKKVTDSSKLKSIVNRETIEILLECQNYDQALDFMGKIHINENKASPEDLLLCYENVHLLIKMGYFDDERLEKNCFILAKHNGLDSVKDLLLNNNLEKIFSRIAEKTLNLSQIN